MQAMESEIIRKCLSRSSMQCSIMTVRGYKVVYRRYASLYFIVGVGVEDDENELALLEAIHCLVETLDRYYESVVRQNWILFFPNATFLTKKKKNRH